MLPIVEIYRSIEGEGSYQGMPITFVRLGGCNLAGKCIECDSKFSYKNYRSFEVRDIEDKIRKLGCNRVSITGGEPILPSNIKELKRLLTKLLSLYYEILIETNCTHYMNFSKRYLLKYIVSPKLKGMGKKVWYSSRALNYYFMLTKEEVEFKFVISSEVDLFELKELLEKYPVFKGRRITLQPNGMVKSLAKYAKAYRALCEEVSQDEYYFWKQYDVRVLMQNHRVAWGQKRGV